MINVSLKVGENIRKIRKSKNITLQQLANSIYKSKSTVAKYEQGILRIDIDTLYEIAAALCVSINFFLVPQSQLYENESFNFTLPVFYKNKMLYAYWWDARNNILNQCVLIINSQDENQANKFKVTFHMNVKNYEKPYLCENTYTGTITFHNVLTSIDLQHRDTPLERVLINILEAFNEKSTKWGLFSGVSFRPFEPVSLKILFSKIQLTFTKETLKLLFINKEDIQRIKKNNYFSAVNSEKIDE